MNPEERVAAYLETGRWPADDPQGPPEGLEQLRALLRDDRAWAEPPPGLADRIVADIAHERRNLPPELQHPPAAEPPHVAQAPDPERSGAEAPSGAVPLRSRSGTRREAAGRRRSTRGVAGLTAGVAAAVVLLAVLVVTTLPAGEPDGEQIALAGTELAPEATAEVIATATGAGVRILIAPSQLPPAPEGFYYQGWVRGPRGSVSIGTFHWRRAARAPIELWSGVALEDYPEFSVTLEPETEEPLSSGQVVLRGTYAPEAP